MSRKFRDEFEQLEPYLFGKPEMTVIQEEQLGLHSIQRIQEDRLERTGLLEKVRAVIRADHKANGQTPPALEPNGLTRAMVALHTDEQGTRRPLVRIETVKPNKLGVFLPEQYDVAIGSPCAGGFMTYGNTFPQDDVDLVAGMLVDVKSYSEQGILPNLTDDLAGIRTEPSPELLNIPREPMTQPGQSDSRFDRP